MRKHLSSTVAVVLIIALLPIGAFAQTTGKIEGTVIDVETKEPLVGADVVIEGTPLGAATRADGRYMITAVLPGEYKLVASMIGYKKITKKVEVFAGEITRVNFSLEVTVLKGDVVIVTATRTEHLLKDAPVVSADVITSEEIKARNIKTVQDALKYSTGVKIYKYCSGWGDKGKIEMQGLDQKHALILVDGQRILGGHQSAVDLQQVPLEMVEKIEVVKGPASVLYGSDAVGGVINIITKTAPEKHTVSFSTAFGSRGAQIHEVSGGFKKGKLGSFLSYTYRESEGVSKEIDQYWENILQGSFSYEFRPQSKLSIKPYYSEHEMKYEGRKQGRFGVNSIWEWAPDELSNLKLRGSLFNYEHWTMDKSSDWDNDNYEIEINYSRLFLGRYTLTAGYQLLEEDVDDRGKNYKADQTLHSFFIQGEIDFLPFTFVLGTRLDEHDKWGTAVNPKASFLYRITEGFKLRGSIGSAFRAPSLVKLYGEGWRMEPFLVHANPDLKPEESIGYQLGAEYMLSEKLSSKLSFFRNEANYLINAQYNEIGPPPWDMNWENIVEVTTQGIEFNLASQIMDNLTGKLGYTFLDTEDESTGKELTYKPNHKLSLELGYKVSKIDLNMNLESEYIGRRYDSDYNKLGGYAIFNLALTKDIRKNIEIFVRVDNIFDKKDIYDEYDIDGAEFLGGVKVRF